MFDFHVVKGDPLTAIRNPGSMVIAEAAANRFFGSANPIGKALALADGNREEKTLVVAAVVRVPGNTDFHFDMAAATLYSGPGWVKYRWENWDANYHVRPFMAYVLLREGADPRALEAKLPDFMERYMGSETRTTNTYHLQPLKRIHLYTHADTQDTIEQDWWYDYSDIQNVVLFSGIVFLILTIGCVNFMILATARSVNRSKEVGLRKVLGAYRSQLIRQFLGEAILLSFLAFVLAWVLVGLALPAFSAFVGRDLALNTYIDHVILLPGLVASTGLLAGCYPAFFMSVFEPVSVLKGHIKTGLRGTLVRKGLVVFQFAMSILLIIGTVIVYRQLSYMQNKSLGFDKELVVNLPIFTGWSVPDRKARYDAVKQAFLAHPNIRKAAAYRFDLGEGIGGSPRELRKENGEIHQLLTQEVDEDFLETFGIELIAGRDFRQGDRRSQTENGYRVILNEKAVRLLGLTDPIGARLMQGNTVNTVIGVMRDFHSQSLHKEIGPLFLQYRRNLLYTLGLKIEGENLPETVAFMEKIWKRFLPEKPFEFSFLDESLDQLYREEMRVGQLVGTFALLAILVACMGLFGLAAFTAEQRTKEIGVRKVLGASVRSVVLLLSKEFARLVLIANVLAWPVAYFAVGDWLQHFAYRVDVTWWVFGLAGMSALLIALGTVSYQALRAAVADPIDALRYE